MNIVSLVSVVALLVLLLTFFWQTDFWAGYPRWLVLLFLFLFVALASFAHPCFLFFLLVVVFLLLLVRLPGEEKRRLHS